MGLQNFIIDGNKLRVLSKKTVIDEHIYELTPEMISELETRINNKTITSVDQLVYNMNLVIDVETWGVSEQDEDFNTLNPELGEEIRKMGVLNGFKYFGE